MAAIWTTPKTWSVGEIVTADMLNTHVRDNFDFLKLREDSAFNAGWQSNALTLTTSSTVFVDMHSTLLSVSLTTTGAPVLLGLCGSYAHSTAGAECIFTLTIDGVNTGDGTYGLQLCNAIAANQYQAFSWSGVRPLAAGAHTIRARWRTNTGVLTASFNLSLYALEMI